MKDDGRLVKNRVLKKLDNDERLFKEKIKNIKYKKRNRFYTIHGGDYNRESDANPHPNPVFYASPRPCDA